MPDVITEKRGGLSRLSNSLVALILGPILIVGAIALLWWNEGRAVQATLGLNEAAAQVVEADASGPSPDNAGKLVHVVGAATATDVIEDPAVGTSFTGQVTVARIAEMYQWDEDSDDNDNTTTYTYNRTWSDRAIDSSGFHYPDGHQNPEMPFSSTRASAPDAKLGGWPLDGGTLDRIDLTQDLRPTPPVGWKPSDNFLYRGDPGTPKIGDMRVRFQGLPSGTTISVLARQSSGGFAAYTASNGYSVELAAIGNHTSADLIQHQRQVEALTTWILRGVGWLVVFVGFASLMAPLSAIASFVPILGGLVRGAVGGFAFVLSVPVTFVVIALAWIFYRPLLGGGLLLAAAVLAVGLWFWHHRRTAARVATATAAAPAEQAPA
jgi:hypothetical protein